MSTTPLNFTATTAGTCKFAITGTLTNVPVIEYKINNGSWTTYTFGTNISLAINDVVSFQGNNDSFSEGSSIYIKFVTSGSGNVSGNVMSLLDKTCQSMIVPAYAFTYLFMGCSSSVTFNGIELPATTLSTGSYQYMFYGCKGLTTPPVLPVTTLTERCYYYMFYGCTSLTTAPELPATTLAKYCYGYMFQGCTALTAIPNLPATDLKESCYSSMFYNCSSITTASIPFVTKEYGSCNGMFYGCSKLESVSILSYSGNFSSGFSSWLYGVKSTGTFYCQKETGTQSTISRSASACPTNWIVVNKITPLSFTTQVANTCRFIKTGTFTNTPSIQYRINDGAWTNYTFGNGINLSANDTVYFIGDNNSFSESTSKYIRFASNSAGNISGDVLSLLTSGIEITTINSPYAFYKLFYGSNATFDGFYLKATTLSNYCYSNMFYGCSNLVKAPELVATTLATGCYEYMFYNCSSLNYIRTSYTSSDLFNNTQYWVYNVSSTGNFYCPDTLGTQSTITRGQSACPTNWVCKEEDYLTLTVTSTGTFQFKHYDRYGTPNLYYKLNANDWIQLTKNQIVSVSNGDTVLFKGSNSYISSSWTEEYITFTTTCTGNMSGNIMSIFDPTCKSVAFSNYSYILARFFENSILTFNGLSLPATTLSQYCYIMMFAGCSNLITAPELPATTLKYGCYDWMFQDCTSLVNAPNLPATTLTNSCYCRMFSGCTSLVNAPSLPATTLVESCYQGMFINCTSLIKAPELIATTVPNYAYYNMFYGCTSLNEIKVGCESDNLFSDNRTTDWVKDVASTGTFICSSAVGTQETITRGDSACPTNWTVSTPPEPNYLKFTTSVSNTCKFTINGSLTAPVLQYRVNYGSWTSYTFGTDISLSADDTVYFRGNNSNFSTSATNYIIFTSTSAGVISGNVMSLLDNNCEATQAPSYTFYHLFYNNNSTFDGIEITATSLSDHCFYGMFEGCTGLTSMPALNASTLATYCYANMFKNCTALVNTSQLNATTLYNSCYYGMFEGCTALTIAPTLIATTLATDCYSRMFYGCNLLNDITVLSNVSTIFNYTTNWVYAVAQEGTFKCLSSIGTSATIARGASACPTNWDVIDPTQIDYFNFHTSVSNSCRFYCDEAISLTLEYKISNGEWTIYTVGNYISLSANDTIYFRGNNARFSLQSRYVRFQTTAPGNVSGNIMTLKTTGGNSRSVEVYDFRNLFMGCSTLTFNGLVLPATSVSVQGYMGMFSGCSAMTVAPQLPATYVGDYGYCGMFQNCSSLTASPNLPATRTDYSCYSSMFTGCTSLRTIGTISATVLDEYSFGHMFKDCTSLVDASGITITSVDDNSCRSMFEGCTSLTNPPTLSATALNKSSYRDMFKGCTSLITAPALPIVSMDECSCTDMFEGCTALINPPTLNCMNLTSSCYQGMFQGCTSLTVAPVLPATTLATYCYYCMFAGCTSLTTPPVLLALNLSTYCYYGMFRGCSSLVTPPALPATTLYFDCYGEMFKDCTSLTSIPTLNATSVPVEGYYKMFYGCTSLTSIRLPGANISTSAYNVMFQDCTSLNSITVLHTSNFFSIDKTFWWVKNVSPNGTFYCDSSVGTDTSIARGESYCPTGWTVMAVASDIQHASLKKIVVNNSQNIRGYKTIVFNGETPVKAYKSVIVEDLLND